MSMQCLEAHLFEINTNLKDFEEQICICRYVVTWVSGILIQIRITIRVKLYIEREHILLLQSVQMDLARRNVNLITEMLKKIQIKYIARIEVDILPFFQSYSSSRYEGITFAMKLLTKG